MIESLFEELSSRQGDGSGEKSKFSEMPDQNKSEAALLAVLPVVRKIVRRKTLLSWQSDTADLVQSIALRLWKWREKYREKSAEMSPDEWESFAARTAYNEVNRYFSNTTLASNVPLEEASEVSDGEFVEGQTEVEFISLAQVVWQEICRLSLRQRRALLLSSWELVFYLLKSGIDDDEMIEILTITTDIWEDIKEKLPLSDARIAEVIQKTDMKQNRKSLTKSIKKARHEARVKLQEFKNK